MQLDFDLGVLLHKLMEFFGLQSEHVTIGKCLGSEDGGEQLPIFADVLCCLPRDLHSKAGRYHPELQPVSAWRGKVGKQLPVGALVLCGMRHGLH